jgi:serine/threonine protein kinase
MRVNQIRVYNSEGS